MLFYCVQNYQFTKQLSLNEDHREKKEEDTQNIVHFQIFKRHLYLFLKTLRVKVVGINDQEIPVWNRKVCQFVNSSFGGTSRAVS